MKTAKQSIDLEYKGTKKRLNLRTALISLCMFCICWHFCPDGYGDRETAECFCQGIVQCN